MTTTVFSSTLYNEIQWKEINTDLGQKDLSSYNNLIQLESGIGWYKEFSLPISGETTISLVELDYVALNVRTRKSVSNIKCLSIENFGSSTIIVGNSGTSSGVSFLSSQQTIGPSGIMSWQTSIGKNITQGTSQIKIKNLDNKPANFKVLIIGSK